MNGKGAVFGAAFNLFAALVSTNSLVNGNFIVGIVCLPINITMIGLCIFFFKKEQSNGSN
jgi:hypothetical protein